MTDSFKQLTPLKTKNTKIKKCFGFDIETYGDKNKFLMGSLYSLDTDDEKPYIFVFWEKHEFLEEIKKPIFRNCYITATNLAFDFFGIFFNNLEINNFIFSFRGGQLIGMKTYLINNKFYPNSSMIDDDGKKKNSKHCIRFIDTINYVFYSVKKLGEIVGKNKLTKPKCLGKIPKNEKEKDELTKYNIRDSEITYLFIRFLFDSFIKLGGSVKMTIASSSMNIFRTKYLKKTYIIHDKNILLDIFKSYYGGRTETFKVGFFENYNYYDFNSLYPTVMLNKYPDTNTLRIASDFNDLKFIKQYEGVSYVQIKTPTKLYYPLLPYRTKQKLLFPLGRFSGWYSHIELRKALDLGYSITKIKKTYYYLKTVQPFNEFVNDLYAKRLREKLKGNPIQLVYKILLNSLYGKFCQKFKHESIQPFNFEIKELNKIKDFERINNFVRYTIDDEPSSFNCVIWGVYITSYARLLLYEQMQKLKPIYVDTDSLITPKFTRDGRQLGDLELEYKIIKGLIIKPKFYGFTYCNENKIKELIKIKGVSELLGFDEFVKRTTNNKDYCNFNYIKFCKFKEAIRRGLIPNQILKVTKQLLKVDNKREYQNISFSKNMGLIDSKPLIIDKD